MLAGIMNFLRHLRNRSKVTTLGKNSVLHGSVDRRAGGSRIEVGRDCLVGGTLVTETNESRIEIGDNVFIGAGVLVDCVIHIAIEQDVLIAHGCMLADSDNHSVRLSVRKNDLRDWRCGGGHDWSTTASSPVRISRGAWLGARSIVLKGVTIGEGAVVGAGSVVTRDVPPYTVVAGNPARIIREIPADER